MEITSGGPPVKQTLQNYFVLNERNKIFSAETRRQRLSTVCMDGKPSRRSASSTSGMEMSSDDEERVVDVHCDEDVTIVERSAPESSSGMDRMADENEPPDSLGFFKMEGNGAGSEDPDEERVISKLLPNDLPAGMDPSHWLDPEDKVKAMKELSVADASTLPTGASGRPSFL